MKNDNGTSKNVYLMLEIALIVFLILLFGSIIGLNITRKHASDFVNNNNTSGESQKTYMEYEDGTKENISDGVVNAEFEYDGLKFSHFEIESLNDVCTVQVQVENTTNLDIEEKTFLLRFYDAQGNELCEAVSLTTQGAVESYSTTKVIAPLREDVVDASYVELEVVGYNESNGIASGEMNVSGEE